MWDNFSDLEISDSAPVLDGRSFSGPNEVYQRQICPILDVAPTMSAYDTPMKGQTMRIADQHTLGLEAYEMPADFFSSYFLFAQDFNAYYSSEDFIVYSDSFQPSHA